MDMQHFNDAARQVIVRSSEEARSLNHGHIGTGHILLGLLRENDGIAARVLVDLGVDRETIRHGVVRMLAEPAARHETASYRTALPPLGECSDKDLKNHIQDLTAREAVVSYERRVLRGTIDLLRVEIETRRRRTDEEGEDVIEP